MRVFVALCAARGVQAQFAHELQHLRALPLLRTTSFELAWQNDGAEAHANQATDGQANGLEHASHFAVAPFGNDHAQPAVRAFATQMFYGGEAGQAVFEFNAVFQLMQLRIGDFAKHAHGVLTLVSVTRVHHAIGNIAGSGENQQTFGVEVESTNRQPFAFARER